MPLTTEISASPSLLHHLLPMAPGYQPLCSSPHPSTLQLALHCPHSRQKGRGFSTLISCTKSQTFFQRYLPKFILYLFITAVYNPSFSPKWDVLFKLLIVSEPSLEISSLVSLRNGGLCATKFQLWSPTPLMVKQRVPHPDASNQLA